MKPRQRETANRSNIRRSAVAALMTTCIVLGIAAPAALHAQDSGGTAAKTWPQVKEEERQQLAARVQAIRQRADELRRAAESRFAETNAACYSKFLVASCLHDAKQVRIKSIQEARRMDLEAGAIERDLNRRLRADDEYRRAQREAEKREQAARGREERATELQRGAARQAEHTRRAEQDGARELQQRRQRDAEKAQARAARVSEAHDRAEAARRQRAEIDRKIAEHAKRQAERKAAAQTPEQTK